MAKDREFRKEAEKEEMTLAESRALRAAAYQSKAADLSDEEKRDEFRKYWAQEKYKYGKLKELEPILWLHLKAVKMDKPEQFEAGLSHFGLKKNS